MATYSKKLATSNETIHDPFSTMETSVQVNPTLIEWLKITVIIIEPDQQPRTIVTWNNFYDPVIQVVSDRLYFSTPR